MLTALNGHLSETEVLALIDHSESDSEKVVASILANADVKTGQYVLTALAGRLPLLERVVRSGATLPLSSVETLATELIEHGLQQKLAPSVWNELIPDHGVVGPVRIHLMTCGYLAATEADLPLASTLIRKTFDAIYFAAERYRIPRICRNALEAATQSREWGLTAKLVDRTVNLFGGAKQPDTRILEISDERSVLFAIFHHIQWAGGKDSLTRLLSRSKQGHGDKFIKGITCLREFLEMKKKSSWFF